ncbi:hypothetical protein [Deinococcus fonticola]|uniref:hypothetical protein n=1 Tax=Deinococcus fonticola TaxID=2528713 RepID=UPI00107557CB|nr:hypothetical protein [Deinococcus fonticola]
MTYTDDENARLAIIASQPPRSEREAAQALAALTNADQGEADVFTADMLRRIAAGPYASKLHAQALDGTCEEFLRSPSLRKAVDAALLEKYRELEVAREGLENIKRQLEVDPELRGEVADLLLDAQVKIWNLQANRIRKSIRS